MDADTTGKKSGEIIPAAIIITFRCREEGWDGGIDSGECAKKLRSWLSE